MHTHIHKRTYTTPGGFTLTETLITLGLVAMLLAIYFTVVSNLFFLRRMKHTVQAANFVQEEIETLHSLEFVDLVNRTEGNFLGLPMSRGQWLVTDSGNPQFNAITLGAAQSRIIDESGLLIVPGNYREDMTFSSRVRIDNASPIGWGTGIAFRYRDSENHYRLRIAEGGITFDKIARGSRVTLWSQNTMFSTGTWYELEVIATGSDFILKRDGVTLTTIADTEFQTGDLALMALKDAIVSFDDVTVTEAAGSTVYDFSADTVGTIPTVWKRMSVADLPGGYGKLTIVDHLGDPDIKHATVTVRWLDGFFPKSTSGTTLITD